MKIRGQSNEQRVRNVLNEKRAHRTDDRAPPTLSHLLGCSRVAPLALHEVEVHEEAVALVLLDVGDEGLALGELLTTHVARVAHAPLGCHCSAISRNCKQFFCRRGEKQLWLR